MGPITTDFSYQRLIKSPSRLASSTICSLLDMKAVQFQAGSLLSLACKAWHSRGIHSFQLQFCTKPPRQTSSSASYVPTSSNINEICLLRMSSNDSHKKSVPPAVGCITSAKMFVRDFGMQASSYYARIRLRSDQLEPLQPNMTRLKTGQISC